MPENRTPADLAMIAAVRETSRTEASKPAYSVLQGKPSAAVKLDPANGEITLTSAAANVTAISGGILVFGDPLAHTPIGLIVQSFAFVLVLVAAWLTPAPMRLADRTA